MAPLSVPHMSKVTEAVWKRSCTFVAKTIGMSLINKPVFQEVYATRFSSCHSSYTANDWRRKRKIKLDSNDIPHTRIQPLNDRAVWAWFGNHWRKSSLSLRLFEVLYLVALLSFFFKLRHVAWMLLQLVREDARNRSSSWWGDWGIRRASCAGHGWRIQQGRNTWPFSNPAWFLSSCSRLVSHSLLWLLFAWAAHFYELIPH